MTGSGKPALSALEQQIMAIVWKRGQVTAADLQEGLKRPLANATVRTLLRRLETKGYVRHGVEGRTFVYRPAVEETQAAARALRGIARTFFGGSAASLMAGMVEEGLVSRDEVRDLSRRLARLSKDKDGRK